MVVPGIDWGGIGSNIVGGLIGAGAANTQGALNAQKYNRFRGMQQAGEQGLMQETANAPAELQAYKQALRSGQTEEQQNALGQTNLGLAQQGVRGGQAAILRNRSVGSLNRQLGQDVNQLAYQDAIRRSGVRTGYMGQKALSAQGTMGSI